MTKTPGTNVGVIISADLAWAISAAATRINKGYLKSQVQDPATKEIKVSNGQLMDQLITTPDLITDEDRAYSIEVRSYFQHLIIRSIAGELKTFLKMALVLSSKDEIEVYGKDWPLLAALPSTYQSELDRKARRVLIDSLEENSTPFGKIGEKIAGEFEVVSCAFSNDIRFRNYATNIRQGNHLFFFFGHESFPVGQTVELNAVIKQHYRNKTTQLCDVHKVKIDQIIITQ